VSKSTPPVNPRQHAGPSAPRAEFPNRSSDPFARPPSGWVHVERLFLNARTTLRKPDGKPITPRERLVWIILDGYCGPGRPFCFPGVDRLAADYGGERRTMFQILDEMERDGIIWRVFSEPERKGKIIGFILLKRTNLNIAWTEKRDIPGMEERLKEAIRESSERRKTAQPGGGCAAQNPAQDPRGKPRESCAENRAIELESLSFEPGELEPEAEKADSKPSERQRPATALEPAVIDDQAEELAPVVLAEVAELPAASPAAEPLTLAPSAGRPRPAPLGLVAALAAAFGAGPGRPNPPRAAPAAAPVEPAIAAAPVEPAPAAAEDPAPVESPTATLGAMLRRIVAGPPPPVESPPRTPSQEAWLASRAPEERQRFDSLPPKDQARLLAVHRDRVNDDPIIVSDQASILRPKVRAAPAPTIPATTAELLEQLPGAPPHWIQLAVSGLMSDFNETPKYRAALEKLANMVWSGEVEASKVVEAHRQAMGPKSKTRGAVFNTALRNQGIVWEGSR
jgi:hypothetical protein